MRGGSTVAATDWISVMDDASLPEGGMQPAYPRGLNVVMARVDGTAHAVSGACAHMVARSSPARSLSGSSLARATTGVSTFGRVSSWMRPKCDWRLPRA